MDSIELINTSRILISGRPSQESLRRAVSTAYYAMFHTLATSNANIIVGQPTGTNRTDWTNTYRSLSHLRAENPLQGWPHLFSPPVRNFAVIIKAMKGQREDADYNPNAAFNTVQVANLIDTAEQAIIDFNATPVQERIKMTIATMAGQRRR